MNRHSQDTRKPSNTELMRRVGQFIIDFDIPFPRSAESRERALHKVSSIAQQLRNEMKDKIIIPATEANVLLSALPALAAIQRMKNDFGNRLPHSEIASTAIDEAIRTINTYFKEHATATKPFGHLSPAELLDLIQANNYLIDSHTKTEPTVYDELIINAHDQLNYSLRAILETLDPQIPRIMLTIETAIDVHNALQQEDISEKPVSLFIKRLRLAWNRFLNRLSGGLSSNRSEFFERGQVKSSFKKDGS